MDKIKTYDMKRCYKVLESIENCRNSLYKKDMNPRELDDVGRSCKLKHFLDFKMFCDEGDTYKIKK